MTSRRTIDTEALAAALAERAREDAAGTGVAASGGPAPGGPAPAAEPDPEELLDYLAGRLPPEQMERVERRLVSDPAAAGALLDLADLEAAGREAGARAEGGDGAPAEPPPADLAVEAGWRELRGRLPAEDAPKRRPIPRAPWLAAAAMAVVALGLGWRVSDLDRELNRPVALAASLQLQAGARSAAAAEEIALPADGWLELAIEPAELCDEPYRAVIEGPGAGDRHTVEALRWTEPGLVRIALRAGPGRYRVTLAGCGAAPQEHAFRVVRVSGGGEDGGG